MQLGHDRRWRRQVDVLWRLGPDRVLVRPVDGEGLDLTALAAMTWIALDEPRSGRELLDELSQVDAGVDDQALEAALDLLGSHGLIVDES